MKLSNKILIGSFGLIFIYMTAAFTEIRFRGNLNRLDDSNSLVEMAAIPVVTYLVIPDMHQSIRVIGSDKAGIEVKSLSGDLLKHLKYEVTGDTLTLIQLDILKDQLANIAIYVPKSSLKGMTTNGARVNIEGLELRTLSISQNNGWIRMNGSNQLGKLNLKAIHGADFYSSDIHLDTLSVWMDDANARIMSTIKLMEGSIKNKSELHAKSRDEIQFKTDKSSRLYLN